MKLNESLSIHEIKNEIFMRKIPIRQINNSQIWTIFFNNKQRIYYYFLPPFSFTYIQCMIDQTVTINGK